MAESQSGTRAAGVSGAASEVSRHLEQAVQPLPSLIQPGLCCWAASISPSFGDDGGGGKYGALDWRQQQLSSGMEVYRALRTPNMGKVKKFLAIQRRLSRYVCRQLVHHYSSLTLKSAR